MKYLKTYEENIPVEAAENVIKKYCQKYPSQYKFFIDFLEYYPTYQDFKEISYDYADDYEDGDEDEGWSPEGEIYQLECTVGSFPGAGIWTNFYNELSDSTWDFNNTPLGQSVKKYNL